MFGRIKPIPRLIIIVGIVAGVGYALLQTPIGNMIKPSNPQRVTQQTQQSSNPIASIIPKALTSSSNIDSYARIQNTREIKIAVQGNAVPFFNNGTGFNPDFMRLVTKQPEFAGINIRVVDEVNTYEEVPKALLKNANGEPLADIAIDGLTLQDGDVGGVTYTIPYVSGFGYALITNRTSGINSVASVGNKRLGILKGDPDVFAYVQKMFPNAQVVELSDALIDGKRTWIDHAFKTGQVDALIYDYPFAVAEISGTSLQFAVSKLPNSDISYKIGVRVNDTNLTLKLNAAIQRVVETDEYRNLLRTYFSSNKIVTTRASASERTYTVQSGDTLSLIAERMLGDRRKFTILEARNNLPNPNLISVGQVLVIPN